MRAPSGISVAREAVRVAAPSQRSWWWRTIGRAAASRSSGSSSLSPISGCVSTIFALLVVERAGFSSTRSGMPILPTSWRIAPSRSVSISSGDEPEHLGDAHGQRGEPFAVAVQVGVARLDRVRERTRERGGEQALAQLLAAPRRALERVGDRVLELGVREGLRDEAGRAARQRLAQRVVGAGAGDEDDRERRARRAYRFEQLEPGEARHDHVADDEVEVVVVEQRQRLLGALGTDDLVAGRLEDLDHELPDDVLVVDHEDAAHATSSDEREPET